MSRDEPHGHSIFWERPMRPIAGVRIILFSFALILATSHLATGQILLSGNENKFDLTQGGQKVIPGAAPDSLTLIDFSRNPPATFTTDNVPNTVIGPPSNIAISPDGKVALVANSVRVEGDKYFPESYAHVVDLTARPPKLAGRVKTDLQPSGLSFTPDGKLALVACRASGTVSVLSVEGTIVKLLESVKVCEPADQVSDVAISPDGKTALASARMASCLVVLSIENGKVTPTGRKISTFGQCYRVVFTPDGQLAVTAGSGLGNGSDMDAITVVEVKGRDMLATDYVGIGVSPESIEISPDGKLLAAVVIEGTNWPVGDPRHGTHGSLVILQRQGKTFVKKQKLDVGRIPEGVAFTSDGKRIVVQCHPDRELWVFDLNGDTVKDSGTRIKMPGMPSSLRAGK
jgi:DNA-binding beta-propeller fold protein YncE